MFNAIYPLITIYMFYSLMILAVLILHRFQVILKCYKIALTLSVKSCS